MSKNENPTLAYLRAAATATGEVVSIANGELTVAGDFSPGIGTYELRAGARVFILNEDDALTVGNVGFDL